MRSPARIESLEARLVVAAVSADAPSPPGLHSRSGAPSHLYLDFNGDIARTWYGTSVPVTPPLDFDGSTGSFSALEQAVIRETHSRVADMFSPFNVDVTTVEPAASEQSRTLRVVIGEGGWGGGKSGLGQYNAFGAAQNWVYVFFDWPADSLASTIAHEAGHGFGLWHQSRLNPDGSVKEEYRVNQGDAGPIMGVGGVFGQRGLWWDGTRSTGVRQSDMEMLAGVLGYAPDDVGGSAASARVLSASSSGSFSSNATLQRTSDVDYFAVDVGGGPLTVTLDASRHARTLDAVLELRGGTGGRTLIARSDIDEPREIVRQSNLAAGRYYLVVRSGQHLNDGVPTSYGEVGQYTLRGSFSYNDGQTPWNGTPIKIASTGASKVEAEDYDLGGPGVSFAPMSYDYRSWAYRTRDGVEVTFDPKVGQFIAGGFGDLGGWVEYTVDIASAGTYDLALRVKPSTHGLRGSVHVEVDGVNKTGTMLFPSPTATPQWSTITRRGITLAAGRHVLRLKNDWTDTHGGGIGNVDWMSFTRVVSGAASISGIVFSDSDRDGIADAGEPRLSGRRLWLDLDRDGVRDSGEPTVLSDAEGRYAFTGLAAGTFRGRRADVPGGYVLTTPTAGYHEVALASGQQVSGKNFGAAPRLA